MSLDLPDPFIELPPGVVDDRLLRDTFEAIQRNLAALANRLSGDRHTIGVVICTFTAAAGTPLVTVTHGLGAVPTNVQLTCGTGSGGESDCWAIAANFTATTFKVSANGTTVRTSTVPVYWMASV